jgi:hypothetical protein
MIDDIQPSTSGLSCLHPTLTGSKKRKKTMTGTEMTADILLAQEKQLV